MSSTQCLSQALPSTDPSTVSANEAFLSMIQWMPLPCVSSSTKEDGKTKITPFYKTKYSKETVTNIGCQPQLNMMQAVATSQQTASCTLNNVSVDGAISSVVTQKISISLSNTKLVCKNISINNISISDIRIIQNVSSNTIAQITSELEAGIQEAIEWQVTTVTEGQPMESGAQLNNKVAQVIEQKSYRQQVQNVFAKAQTDLMTQQSIVVEMYGVNITCGTLSITNEIYINAIISQVLDIIFISVINEANTIETINSIQSEYYQSYSNTSDTSVWRKILRWGLIAICVGFLIYFLFNAFGGGSEEGEGEGGSSSSKGGSAATSTTINVVGVPATSTTTST